MPEQTVEVVEAGPTLRELAATANCEHEQVALAFTAAVEHAIHAGEALIAAKAACPSGTWRAWLGENFNATRESANIYMRIARHQEAVLAEDISSIGEARRFLAETVPRGAQGAPRRPQWMKDEAIRLHQEEDKSTNAIAKELGVSFDAVKRWLDPSYSEKAQAKIRARQQRRSAERQALVEREHAREVSRAARKAGAALSEAYAMAERMQDVIGRAHRETDDREAREALSEAGVHYRKMRDEIVRALGVAPRRGAPYMNRRS